MAIDSNPGSRYDTVRVAQDVDPVVAGFLAEAGTDLPGVQVVVETQRTYAHPELFSHILGYTGPISGEEYADMREVGYLPDDLIGRAGVESTYEEQLRGMYGLQLVETDPSGPPHPGDQHRAAAACRELASADDRHQGPAGGREGAPLGDEGRQPQAGGDHRHEPAERRDPRDGQLADVRQQRLLRRHRPERVPEAPRTTRRSRSSTTRSATNTHPVRRTSSSPAPASSRTARSRRRRRSGRRPTSPSAASASATGTAPGFGMCNIYCGFGHSSDTFFYQAAAMLGIDRLGYWAKQYGFGRPTGIDLPSEVGGIVPDEPVEDRRVRPADLPGRGLPRGHRPGL